MAGPDLTPLVTQIQFDTTTLALMGVFASIAVVYVTWKGVLLVLAAISGKVLVGNRLYDRDVYDNAMGMLWMYQKSGGKLSKEDRQAYTAWRDKKARDVVGL